MKKLITLLICLSSMLGIANAATYYVDLTGGGSPTGDGSSWANAFQTWTAFRTAGAATGVATFTRSGGIYNIAGASWVTGTSTITLATANPNIAVNDGVSGTGIPSSTTVTAISGNTITINKTTTATVNGGFLSDAVADEIYIKGPIPSQSVVCNMVLDNYYGGFAGTESTPSQRAMNDNDGNGIVEPWEFLNPTTYTISGNNINGFATFGGIIDGFTITSTCTGSGGGKFTTFISTGGHTIRNCVFSGSTLTYTGVTQGSNGGCLLSLVNSNFINNLVEKNTVSVTSASTDVKSCPILDVLFPASGSASLVVSGSIFRNNKASITSGASSIANSLNKMGYILNVTHLNNTSASVTFSDCIIHNNEASFTSTYTTPLVPANTGITSSINFSGSSSVESYINCLFANNKSTNLNSCMAVNAGGARKVYNCAFWNNQNSGSSVSMKSSGSQNASSVFSNNYLDVATVGTWGAPWNVTTNKIDLSTTNTDATKGPQFKIVPLNGAANIIGNSASFTSGTDLTAISQSDWRINSGSYLIGKGTTTGTTLILPFANKDKSGYNFSPSSPAVGPYEGSLIVLAGSPQTISTTTYLNTLTVNAGGQLTINNGVSFNVGELILESDATGTATFMDSNTEPTITATVQQYLPQGRNWYAASPIETNIATATNLSAAGATSVSYYDETSGWVNNYTGTLVEGVGYIAVSSAGTSTNKINITGKLNTGDVPVTLTNSPSAGKGFNLVGNPYPSYLSWSSVVAGNAAANMPTGTMWYRTTNYNGKSAWTPSTAYSLNDIVYNGTRFYKVTTAGISAASGGPTGGLTGITDGSVVWNYEGSIYIFATVNASGVVAPETSPVSNLIPPMQAFWVKSTGGTLTFKNTMRTHNMGGANALKAPKSAASDLKLLRLKVSNGASADEAVIYASNDASNAFDTYDAPKYFNTAGSNQPEIYTQVGNEKLVINAMSELNQGAEIPLGFATEKGNNFTISASEFRNFGSDVKVILKDKQTITEFDLTSGQSYAFSSEIVNNTDRFSIIFRTVGNSTGIGTTEKPNAQAFVNAANQITIIAPEKSNYAIYNALGQLSAEGTINHSPFTINHSKGVYVVKVNNQSTRVIIK